MDEVITLTVDDAIDVGQRLPLGQLDQGLLPFPKNRHMGPGFFQALLGERRGMGAADHHPGAELEGLARDLGGADRQRAGHRDPHHVRLVAGHVLDRVIASDLVGEEHIVTCMMYSGSQVEQPHGSVADALVEQGVGRAHEVRADKLDTHG